MRRLTLLILLSVLLNAPVKPDDHDAVIVAAPHWEGQANPDGTGFYWDLIRTVFASEGIPLKIVTTPWKRSILLTQDGEVDGFLGSVQTNDRLVYPLYPLDFEITAALRRASNEAWQGASTMQGKTVGFVLGYDYDRIFNLDITKLEVIDMDNAIKALQLRRVDYVIDDYATVYEALNRLNLTESDYAVHIINRVPIYLTFHESPRGIQLAKIWDQHFPQLIQTGQIQTIFQRYGYEAYYQLLLETIRGIEH